MKPLAAGARLLAALTLLGLAGCLENGGVAGGSSEVDNPIIVAFVDGTGAGVSTSGSVSVYLADQNPAFDPSPRVQRQVNGSTVTLTARDFTAGTSDDSARAYNILLMGSDSTGGLVRNLVYRPALRRYELDSAKVTRIEVRVAPLVRYEASLHLSADTGLVRIIVPGTPFQTVVVDSAFVLEGVPQGPLPLHILPGDGTERPLKPANPGSEGNHHQIDSAQPPVVHPPGPPPQHPLGIQAGEDRSVPIGGDGTTAFSLNAVVSGVDPQDPRLRVRWRQILPGPQNARATIHSPLALNTPVTFPRPGVYGFIVSAGLALQIIEDTVYIGVQPPQPAPTFIQPASGDVAHWSEPFEVSWEDDRTRTLHLELTVDTGKTWNAVATMASRPGMNRRAWVPSGGIATTQAALRLKDSTGTVSATSPNFTLAPALTGGAGASFFDGLVDLSRQFAVNPADKTGPRQEPPGDPRRR